MEFEIRTIGACPRYPDIRVDIRTLANNDKFIIVSFESPNLKKLEVIYQKIGEL